MNPSVLRSKLLNNGSTRLRGYIALILGVLALSLSPILVKGGDAPTVVTSFYRMLIAAAFWTVFLGIKTVKTSPHAPIQEAASAVPFLVFPILAGFSSSMDHGLWALAMNYTSVSNTSVLNGMAPVWISAAALIFLHEKFNRKFWIGLFLAITGMVLMSGQGADFFIKGFNKGDLIAITSSMFYGGYFFFTQLGRRHFSTLFQMWASIVCCAFGLFILCRILGYPLGGYSTEAWRNFILVALICQIGGYFFITYALGCLPASIVSPSNELNTVISSLIAIPVFGEMLSWGQIFGCLAILAGVYLINNGKADSSAAAENPQKGSK